VALIKCPECSREISDKADSCPQCGCPISKAESLKEDIQTTQEPIQSSYELKTFKASSNISDEIVTMVVIALISAVILGALTNSTLVGIFTFVVGIVVAVRVNYLAKHPYKRFRHERHIYTWKGILAFFVIISLITTFQGIYYEHVNKLLKDKEKQEKHKLDINNLAQAKILIAKAPNLSDDEWLKAKSYLTSIDKDAVEYTETQKLLSTVIQKTDVIIRQREALKKKEQYERETAGLSAKGKRLKEKHPNWSIGEADAISKGQIWIGMTKEQVAASWGRPYQVNKTVGSFGTHEQWVMHEYGNTYVYFENGICTSMQGVK